MMRILRINKNQSLPGTGSDFILPVQKLPKAILHDQKSGHQFTNFKEKWLLFTSHISSRPTSSEVLTAYLLQCSEPPWTSYFVKYSSVKDDQFGMSNFNWKVGASNYQILRTGCFPYIKYHCSRKKKEDLDVSDKFMRVIKVVNLGIPCLLYGLAATQLIRHTETVHTSKGPVAIYFLLPEDKGSEH